MAICKFFQQGHCRKGFDCEFEHIKTEKPFTEENRRPKRTPRPPTSASTSQITLKTSGPSSNLRSVKSVDSHVTKDKPFSKGKGKQRNNNNGPKVKGKSSGDGGDRGRPNQKGPRTPKVHAQHPRALPKPAPTITIKNYVDMVMADLSVRPYLWHFSSYGLSLNSHQSLPFPFLGTTELSSEELRLQIYAEAAATGGRIDNYLKVTGEIKERAEFTTKALIPNLETVISDLLRVNNVSINAPDLVSHQEALKETLRQRISKQPTLHGTQSTLHPTQSTLHHHQSFESLIKLPEIPFSTNSPSNSIIPDDDFAFGSIPELPPSF